MRRALLLVVAVLAAFGLGTAVLPAAAAVDPATAAAGGAAWAAGKVNAEGFVPGPGNTANVSATIEIALDLALTATDQPTFDRILAWLQANPETAIAPDGTDSPGNLGYLLILATAAGIDPTGFGGRDLPARLAATLTPSGLYGTTDPTYDGVFRQSLALLGLRSAGLALPATAVAWLEGQQCGAAPAAAAGGFPAYRADTAVPCDAPDPMTFVGPDTNSTALAALALTGVAGWTGGPAALDFLAAAQGATGGAPFISGGDVDPNSTALVILAVRAAGEDPAAGRWVSGGTSLVASLLSWRLDCAVLPADCGAFASPFSGGAADAFATRQAVWGLSGGTLLVTGPVSFQQATTTTTSTSTTSTTSTTAPATTSTTVVVTTTAAAAVTVTPAYAG